ncbi:MAG: T9SS type A sorting domain-containing protein [Bacteroidetes bacterium]|nr:T9SS type A sorting domain-containing protein [Bacteroidota bacterium]
MRVFHISVILFLITFGSYAQPLTGTKTIPGDYPTIQQAIAALNLYGTASPGVTFNIASGYAENENTSTLQYVINTNTGSASAPIVFQKTPGGAANPKIYVYGGAWGVSSDAGIIIAGTDYITFDGINIQATDATIEWGYGLVKRNSTVPFDGCQHVVIRNCNITLNKTNGSGAYGVYSGNHIATNLNQLTITSQSDANSYCQFYNDTISNVNYGFYLYGYNASNPYSLYDQNNEIGVSGANVIKDYGSSTNPSGINISYQNNINISNNSITSAIAASSVFNIYGIYLGTATQSSATVSNNTISINSSGGGQSVYCIYSAFGGSGSSNILNINNNIIQNVSYPTASSAYCYGIFNTFTNNGPGTINITNNSIHDINIPGTGNLYGLDAGSALNINIYNDTLYNLTKNGNSNLYTLQAKTGTLSIHNNYLHDINITTGSGTLYGIIDVSSPTNETYYSNTISDFNHQGNGDVYGMHLYTTGGTRSTYSNIIHSLTSTGGTVTGMYHDLSTPSIFKNTIYDLTSTTSTGMVNGVSITGGNNIYFYNNFISDLKTPQATGTNAIKGINKTTSGNVFYCYNNSIYINAISNSTTTFGTSGIHADTYYNIELKNNIVINNSTPVFITAPAYTVAYRRSSATISTYSSASNNNCFYAGNPGPNNLIYYDGTNGDQTVTMMKVRVSPRETNSFTELPPFVNAAGHDLHISASTPTAIESSGLRITTPIAVSNDYDGDIRFAEIGYTGSGTAPDVGADEGNFTAFTNMSYQSSTVVQQSNYVFSGNTNQAIIQIKVSVDGNASPLSVNQFNVNSNGTTNITDINTAPAKIYYTGNSAIFGPGILFGSATPAISNFTISGAQTLINGDNYFWLVYDIKQTASTGNFIDGECTSIAIGGVPRIPSITVPAGNRIIYGPMSGTYLVGAGNTYPNFATLTEAALHINNRGLNAPVILSLTNNASIPYNVANGEIFPITFTEIPLASLSNTITLKPANGVSPIITSNSTTSTLFLNGTDYFIINGSNSNAASRNLTVENSNTANGTAALQISTGPSFLGANHNTIKNCVIWGGEAYTSVNANYALSVGSAIGSVGEDNDYLTIDNNEISRAFYGLYIGGNTTFTTDNLSVTNNTIGSADSNYFIHYCGAIFYSTSGTISGNEIKGVQTNVYTGNYATLGVHLGVGVKNMSFVKNSIHGVGNPSYINPGTGVNIDLASPGNNVTIANNIIYDISGLGSGNIGSYGMAGIKINGISTNVKIYYNSINLSGYINSPTATSDISAAMYIGNLVSQIDIRNNIFSNSIENTTGISKAYAIYSAASTSVFTNLDYNDYYVSGNEGVLGYSGSDKLTLANWKTATGKDVNSKSVSPDFNSNTNLIPYIGSAILDVCSALTLTDDYNATLRTVPTSMGAYEIGADKTAPIINYQPLYNTHLLSSRTLTAYIHDYHGSVPTNGIGLPRLYWRINNNPYSIVSGVWVSDSTFQFSLGSGVVLGNTVSYFIVAQDTMSSSNVGSYPSLNSGGYGSFPPSCSIPPTDVSTYKIVTGISGIKNIPGDYANLTGASGLFADINNKVLTGNLVVKIYNNLNEDGLNALNEINVDDTSYHLSIIMGDTLAHNVSGNYQGTLIRFNGADGVTINGNKKLWFTNNNSNTGNTLCFTNGCNNNMIDGCIFTTSSASNYIAINLLGSNKNNIIKNNTIYKCAIGINLDGVYWNQSSGNVIYNNVLGTSALNQYIYNIAIKAIYQDQLTIKGNEVCYMASNSTNLHAIYLEAVTNSIIEKNNLHDNYYAGSSYYGASGITNKSMNDNPNIIIRNNIIRHLAGLGSSPDGYDNGTIPAGIKLYGNSTSGIYIYNNSINMNKDTVNGVFYNNEWFTALEVGAGVSGVTLLNNILQNSVGERASSTISWGYAIYCKSATSPFANINNNIYYVSNYDNNYVALVGTVSPPVNNMNLAQWRTFTGHDLQSLNTDPLFTSVTNLIPKSNSPAIGAGQALPGIVDDDFIAYQRGIPTTIGAYEVLSILTTCISPSIQASSFTVSTLSNTSISAEWSRGNGNAVLVLARQGSAVNSDPLNGSIYSANSDFGSGSQIGNGNFVVYNGTGNNVNITALTQETTYHFAVYEYNTLNTCYKVAGATTFGATSAPNSTFTAAISNAWENAANWNHGVPSAATFATIAATKLAIVNSNNCQCKNLTIAPLGKLTINAGKDLTVKDSLTLQSDTTGSASLIDNGTLFSSTNIVDRYIPHTFNDEFHMLSSPVAAQSISPIFNEPYGFFVWDEATGNWVDFADATNFAAANGGSNFIPAKGYAVSYPTATTKSFVGNLNTGTINIPLSVTAGLYSGWNFVANPYPSAINWNASSGWNRSMLENADPINHPNEKAIWVWNAQAANYGAFISNTDAATNGVSRNVATSQGFWVKATTAGSLAMNNEVREHADQAFLKSSTPDEMIRLKVTNAGNTYSDELIVSFGNISNQGGAEKMFSIEATAPSIYSCKLNKKWSISNLTSIADNTAIPVSFKAGVNGNYTITASELNSFASTTYVYLKDLKTNTIVDLNQNANYTFAATTNDNADRFQLIFAASPLGISDNQIQNTSIYSNNNNIYITSNETVKQISVYNTLGQLVKTIENTNGMIVVNMNGNVDGYYIVRVITNKNVYSEKVLIK